MYLEGPAMQLIFRAFVVVVGAVILAGAVNTAIVGSEWGFEPRFRRRSPPRLVSASAPALWYELSHHQHYRHSANRYDFHQSRRLTFLANFTHLELSGVSR